MEGWWLFEYLINFFFSFQFICFKGRGEGIIYHNKKKVWFFFVEILEQWVLHDAFAIAFVWQLLASGEREVTFQLLVLALNARCPPRRQGQRDPFEFIGDRFSSLFETTRTHRIYTHTYIHTHTFTHRTKQIWMSGLLRGTTYIYLLFEQKKNFCCWHFSHRFDDFSFVFFFVFLFFFLQFRW